MQSNTPSGYSPPLVPNHLKAIIALNVLVFIAWNTVSSVDQLTFMRDQFLVSTESMSHGRVWTLVTSEMSHNDVGHLLMNMYALWLFGTPVAHLIGARSFQLVYWTGAVVASITYVVSSYIGGTETAALGASGAVMTISMIYASRFPERRLLLFLFIPVSARMAAIFYVVMDVAGMIGVDVGPIAHAAHLGGAALGLLYCKWRWGRVL